MGDHDYYDDIAEFYELSAAGSGWAEYLNPTPASRQWLRPDLGPLIDLAAGSGLSTVALADAFPEAQIFAVEPSRGMRTALTARVMTRPDLRQRVTIVPGDLSSRHLPAVWGGLTARGLMGQLPADNRQQIWQFLAQRLAPEAGAIIDQVSHEAPKRGNTEVYESTTSQGEFDYLVTITAIQPEHEPPSKISRYVVTNRSTGEVVSDCAKRSLSWPVTRAELEEELRQAGLSATDADDNTLLVTRSASR